MSLAQTEYIQALNQPLIDSEDEEMAEPNLQLLKLYVDTIPYFDGNSNTLEVFISSCDYLCSTYGRFNDVILKDYLLRAVIGKLTGRAQILIGSRNGELKTWDSVKEALRQSFGDQRNLECLEQDLLTLVPYKNEKPIEFGQRIQIAKSKLSFKIESTSIETMPLLTKEIHLKQYNQLALKTFIRGLTGNLQTTIRLRNPNSIEQAMNFVTEEENFRYTQNFSQQLLNTTKQNNHSNNIPHVNVFPTNERPQYNFSNTQPQQSYNNFNHVPNFQQNRSNFPSQPINIQTRPVKQHFPTARQVFGPPKKPINVFQPTSKKPDFTS